jgi:hypothetical protein
MPVLHMSPATEAEESYVSQFRHEMSDIFSGFINATMVRLDSKSGDREQLTWSENHGMVATIAILIALSGRAIF